MKLDPGGGGGGSKKKKKKKKKFSSSSSPSPTSYSGTSYGSGYQSGSSSAYGSGSYTPPKPKRTPKPKPYVPAYFESPSYAKRKTSNVIRDIKENQLPPAFTLPDLASIDTLLPGFKKEPKRKQPSLLDILSRPLNPNDPALRPIQPKPAELLPDKGEPSLLSTLSRPLDPDDPAQTRPDDLQKLIQQLKASKKAPVGYDPFPKKAETKYDHNGELKKHWNEDYIKNVYLQGEEGDYVYDNMINNIIARRFADREEFFKSRNMERVERLEKIIERAVDAGKEGDFDFLEKRMQKNPDLFKLPKYREEFGITPEMLERRMEKQIDAAGDDADLAQEIIDEYEGYGGILAHYRNIREGNAGSSSDFGSYKWVNQRVNEIKEWYLEERKDSIEYQSVEGKVDPGLPDFTPDQEALALKDEIARQNPYQRERALIARDYSFDPVMRDRLLNQSYKKEKAEIRKNLGSPIFPSVRKMLKIQAYNGDVNLNKPEEVAAAVERLKNSAHPDTRALMVSLSLNNIKDEDKRKEKFEELAPWINEYVTAYQENQEYLASVDNPREDGGNPIRPVILGIRDDMLGGLAAPFKQTFGGAHKALTESGASIGLQGYKANPLGEDQRNATPLIGAGAYNEESPLMWTFDKMLRLLYGVAGAYDEYYSADKDQNNSWSEQNPVEKAGTLIPGFGHLLGKNILSSADEVVSDPSVIKDIGQRAYSEVFRDSGLPGVEEIEAPTTFSHVIANNALYDERDNLYDEVWYQNAAGLAADVVADPLSWIGIGGGAKAGSAKKALEAKQAAEQADEIYDPLKFTGVGSTDDLMKLPAELVFPGRNNAQPFYQVPRENLDQVVKNYTKTRVRELFEASSQSPKVERLTRIRDGLNQLSDDIQGIQVGKSDSNITNARMEIQQHINELEAQRQKLVNAQVAEEIQEQMVDEIDRVGLPIQIEGEQHLRADAFVATLGDRPNSKLNAWMSTLEGQVADPALGLSSSGMRGKGYSRTYFGNDQLGQAARQAQEQLDAMEEAARKGSINLNDSAQAEEFARLNEVIDKAIQSKQSRTRLYISPEDVGKYVKENPTAVPDVRNYAAKAMGIKADDFPLTNSEVWDSLRRGDRIFKESYSGAKEIYDLALDQVRRSQATLAKQAENTPEYFKALRSVQHAERDLATYRIAGALKHMQSKIAVPVGQGTKRITQLRAMREQLRETPRTRYMHEEGDLGGFGNAGEVASESPIQKALNTLQEVQAKQEGVILPGIEDLTNRLRHAQNMGRADDDLMQDIAEFGLANDAEKLVDIVGEGSFVTHQADDLADSYVRTSQDPTYENTARYGEEVTGTESYKHLEEMDLLDSSLEELLDPNTIFASGFANRGAHLDAIERAIDKQIAQELKKMEGELWDIRPDLPPGIIGADGKVNTQVLGKYISYNSEKKAFEYKGHGLPADQTAALRALTAELEHRRSIHYRRLMDEATKKINVKKELNEKKFLDKWGEKPKSTDTIKSLSPRSAWAKDFPEGFSSRKSLTEYALNHPDNFYNAFYLAGSPFRYKPPVRVRLTFRGKQPKHDYPTSLRDTAAKSFGAKNFSDLYKHLGGGAKYRAARKEIDDYMRRVSDEVYDQLMMRSGKVQTLAPKAETKAEVSLTKDTLETADTVGDVPAAIKSVNEAWNRTITARSDAWERGLAAAKREDAALSKQATKAAKTRTLTLEKRNQINSQAVNNAKREVVDELNSTGLTPEVPQSSRLIINPNQVARANEMAIINNNRSKTAHLQAEKLTAESLEDIKRIDAEIAQLQKQTQDLLRKNRAVKDQSKEHQRVLQQRLREEYRLQLLNMPARMDERMLQLRVMGMRKNLQFTKGLFRGAQNSEKVAQTRFAQKFSETFVRPSKQLDTIEAQIFRARFTNMTPVIIKAHLTKITKLFDETDEVVRKNILSAYRNKTPYTGRQSEKYDAAAKEFDEIEKIWQQQNDLYRVKRNANDTDPYYLPVGEILHYLPSDYQPAWKDITAMRQSKEGVTLDGILESIKKNGGNPDIDDPFRMVWVMRLAADQAHALRGLKHSISNTFGIERIGKNVWDKKAGQQKFKNDKTINASIVEEFKKDGWETVDWLGNTHYFPPEVLGDIRRLKAFTEPKEVHKIMRTFDTAIGYWKQGMTIYNPGYYTRNGIGEMMASWLDGVNNPKYYQKSKRIMRWINDEGRDIANMMEKWSALKETIPYHAPEKATQTLFSIRGKNQRINVSIERTYKAYVQHGLKSTFANTDLERGVRSLAGQNMTDNHLRKALRKGNTKVHDVGEGFEDWLRLAHFIHAAENSGKRSVDEAFAFAAEKVKKYHFDYSDFSTFEQSVMLRAFPFYKWTRRGAPLMFQHLFMTPGKMTAYPKTMDAISGTLTSQDVHEDPNGSLPHFTGIAPSWVKDLFSYQMGDGLKDGNDEYSSYFRLATPQIDGLNAIGGGLGFIGDPTGAAGNVLDQGALPLLNPLFRGAAELGMNQTLTPDEDMRFPILGGEYNEQQGINTAESLLDYFARNVNPVLGGLTQLSKNNQLPVGNMGDDDYREEHGYDKEQKLLSMLTGLGFYQAKDKPFPALDPELQNTETGPNAAAVGYDGLSKIPNFGAPLRAGGLAQEANVKGLSSFLDSLLSSSGKAQPVGDGDGKSGWKDFGSNWKDFGDWWTNYGGGGYYGGGSGSSGSISGGSSGDLYALLQALKEQIDQGQVNE